MRFCLWLCGNKVSRASQIKDSFDLPALKGYLLGGSLIKWLEENGGKNAAKKLKKIDYSGNVEEQLEKAFGVKSSFSLDYAPRFSIVTPASVCGKSCSSGSFKAADSFFGEEREIGSFGVGSFGTGSFYVGSFRAGSFEIGSFNAGSFRVGSFTAGGFTADANGSFTYAKASLTQKEYKETIFILSTYPLNKYGYGIHLI